MNHDETKPEYFQEKVQKNNEDLHKQQKLKPQIKNHKKKIKHVQIPIYKNLNAFKEQQKHYKLYSNKETDFSTLFKLQNPQNIEGLNIYHLPYPDGAILIKNFNSHQIVRKIGKLALNQFCKKPYRTNLDSRNQLYEQNKKGEQEQEVKQNIPIKEEQNKGYTFNDKIRWANVGKQYDWTLRKYPDYNTPMHEAIAELTQKANAIYNKITGVDHIYHPQSAIVNYYGNKDYMTGHLDDAQIDQTSPIYSFSFGISCIFLMGGRTKQEKPIAVRLDSGDLFIMARQSRKCYHGVPRVLQNSYKKVKVQQFEQEKQLGQNMYQNVQNYYQHHRININIRQVFPHQKQKQEKQIVPQKGEYII